MKKRSFRKLNSVLVALLLLVNIMLPSNNVFAKNGIPTISIAPLNPEFIKYQKEKNSGVLDKSNVSQTFGANQGNFGIVPLPSEGSFKMDKKTQTLSKGFASSILPAQFDLRTVTNKLSPVRNQNPYGSCWSFATYGSLESYLRPSEVKDFSEDNLMRTHGFDRGPNNGGNERMSMAYLSRWSGAISESDDPYDTPITPTNLKPQEHVQNVDYVTGTSLDDLYANIKETIQSKGAVYTHMYWDANYYDQVNKSYFCNYSGLSINHAVSIVGWDDNFSRDKFNTPYGSKPENNGAFIIRNSWGPDWGEGGYFYISYEDLYSCLHNASFNNGEPVNNYSSIYQYDSLGWINSIGLNTNSCYAANVFTATSNQILSATGFYTTAVNTAYEIKIYDTVNNGVFSGLKATKLGTISNIGYHTVQLGTGVQLTAGKKFAVTIKFTTPNYIYPVAFEMPISDYSSSATANPGESYLSLDGSTWNDLVSYYGVANSNVCIKAFTTNTAPRIIGTSPTNLTTNVPVGNNISVKFSEAILGGRNFGNITVKNSSGAVVAATKTISGDALIINPTSNLIGNAKYTVTIPAGAVKDSEGLVLVSQYSFSFTTGANTAPTVKSTTPVNLTTNIANYKDIYVRFSENIFSGTNYGNITVKNASGTVVSISKLIRGNTLVIHPNSFFTDNTKYTVTVPAGSVKDNQGLGLASQKTFTFTTAVNTAPIVVNVTLPNTALDYGNKINIKFSEAIYSGTNYRNITVKNSSGTVIAITKSISRDTLILDPNGSLAGNSKYTVTIPAGAVKDSIGAALVSQYTFSFTITTLRGSAVIKLVN